MTGTLFPRSVRLLLFFLLFASAFSACNGDSDSSDPDGDRPADGDENPPDGDMDGDIDAEADDEDDGESDEPLPDEIGCEVDPDVEDGARSENFDPEGVAYDTNVFTVLVQAGSMTESEAILWTYAEDDQPKRLRVWRQGEEAGTVKLVFDEDVTPAEGYIKRRVMGLAARTDYSYAFFTMDGESFVGRSMIGHFRTAFPPGCLAPLVIGGTHGTNAGKQPFKALEITATYDLDLFVHLGDYSYNDGAVLDDGAFREEVTSENFRTIWKRTLDDPGMRALLPSTGQYIVRDDHEVCDNSCLEDSDFREEIHFTGMDAFIETTPVDAEGYKLWRSYEWGDTAEIFLLDCRSERVPDTRQTEEATYIGPGQMAWLKQSLSDSQAHFKIILNSVPITLFDHVIWLMDFDRWQGYAAQREELLDFILDEGIENVWWLTGDFHLGSVNRVQSSGEYASMWEIMMGPGGNDGNPIWPLYNGELPIYTPEEIAPPEQFDFFYGEKATTIVTFDPIRDTVHVLFFDAETGESLYDKELAWTPLSPGKSAAAY